MSDFDDLIPLRINEVKKIAGNVDRSTIYRWMDLGLFPQSIRLGPGSVGWNRREVLEWAKGRK